MVTFTFGERKAQMYLQCDAFEGPAYLRWGYNSINNRIFSGEDVLEFLAEKWRCKPEEIQHDLPTEISTSEQELDFAMFYDGHPMAYRGLDGMIKLVWCGWTYKANTYESTWHRATHRSWNEPIWRDVIMNVEFEARTEYYEAAVKRIMTGDDKLGARIADSWKMVDRDGKSYVDIHIWANHLTPFRVYEGEFLDGVFHVRRMTDEVIRVTIPFPSDAKRALNIVAEEKNKAILDLMSHWFPTGTDVAIITDFQDSILYGVDPLPHSADTSYSIVWSRVYENWSVSALLVRIPKSGQIRCPDEYKGRLIGQKGVKINELAKKHGHCFLRVI